ncbi:MAG: cytochrome c oxidase subunit II [Nitrososphaerales archaeon]
MKKKNVLLAWVLILFVTVIVLEVIYTPYDYAGYRISNNVGEGVAQADYPSIEGPYQVVYVTCEQWQFMFYPHVTGVPTVAMVRANIPVLFIVRSVDVTHGFYVNTEGNFVTQGFQFGVMAVPGYIDYVVWNFQPTVYQNGISLYHVQCSEYCGVAASGLGHPWMDALIQVVPDNSSGITNQMQQMDNNTPPILMGTVA